MAKVVGGFFNFYCQILILAWVTPFGRRQTASFHKKKKLQVGFLRSLCWNFGLRRTIGCFGQKEVHTFFGIIVLGFSRFLSKQCIEFKDVFQDTFFVHFNIIFSFVK